jgi:hypothetical protein
MYHSETSQYFYNTNIERGDKKLLIYISVTTQCLHNYTSYNKLVACVYINQCVGSFHVSDWVSCISSTSNLTALFLTDTP